jgi:hypothetical protein
MDKDTYYFSHDYNTRNDQKIKKLISKHGYLGYGLFWAIVEDLYNNANALHLDYDSIAFDLRTNNVIVKSIINDFDLFIINDNIFGSMSIQKRLDERDSKSKKARESARYRWDKLKSDANALQTQYDSNAIKERKGNENKGKEIKLNESKEKNNIDERKLKFASTLKPFLDTYGKEMLNDFYLYWTEPNKSNTKFRQEMEKTWSLERRLETWSKNDFKNKEKSSAKKESKISQLKSVSDELDIKLGISQNNQLKTNEQSN